MPYDVDIVDIFMWIIIPVILLGLGVGMYFSWKANVAHEKDLAKNGCQLIVATRTGRTIRNGKLSHEEVAKIYECSNGNRLEMN